MADFVAVLKKTLDGLSETTPQMREKVYEKARLTIAGKLAAMNPLPADTVIDRQKRALEDAIAQIEKEFALAKPTPVDPLTELENVFASLKNPVPLPVKEPAPKPEAPRPAVQLAEPPRQAPIPAVARTEPTTPTLDDDIETEFNIEPDDTETIAADVSPRRGFSVRPLVMALAAVAVIAGAGYGVWSNRAAFAELFSPGDPVAASDPADVQPVEDAAAPDTEVAAVAPAEEPDPAPIEEPAAPIPAEAAVPAPGELKFTQRLNADGTEIDAGPAGGTPAIGEGTSVASVTQPPAADAPPPVVDTPQPVDPSITATESSTSAPADVPVAAAEAPAAGVSEPAAAAPATIPVGQRAIFYEERTNVAQASAEPGSIVWSLVQESPGGDLPPEPAIRAEATIPGKDVQLRMTIRRNGDKTLPASHIIEVIFLTPEGFEGGGIDNVLRFSMKGSEQEAGSPLLGIPAKIADGFFLIALNDSKPEIDANMTLLRSQSWIDVPVQYKSGRRALFTMEKGIPGSKVFDEALKAWQAASVATNAPG